MARVDNWQTRLTALIEEKRQEPFDLPHWNCLMWAFAGVQAVTDVDLGEPYRGRYKDEAAAVKLLQKLDKVRTSLDLLTLKLDKARAIGFARHGDIVFITTKKLAAEVQCDLDAFGPIPGLCYGQRSYFVGQDGLVEIDTLRLGKTIWVS